jgi:putative oxidoreductase
MAIGWMSRLRKGIAPDHWGLVPLRIVIGFGFAAHGYAKLVRGPDDFARIVAALGMPAPLVTAWVTSLLEFAGGILLMLGAFVVPVSVPLGAILLVAIFGVHLRYGYSSVRLRALSGAGAEFGPIGYELDLLYLAGLATVAWSRSSRLSVDWWIGKFRRSRSPRVSVDTA